MYSSMFKICIALPFDLFYKSLHLDYSVEFALSQPNRRANSSFCVDSKAWNFLEKGILITHSGFLWKFLKSREFIWVLFKTHWPALILGISSESKTSWRAGRYSGWIESDGKREFVLLARGGEGLGRTGGQNNFPTQSPTWGRRGNTQSGIGGILQNIWIQHFLWKKVLVGGKKTC